MKLSIINQWLTLGANVGVLIGIIFLILELSQNTAAMRVSAVEDQAQGRLDVYAMIVGSQELQGVLAKVKWASLRLCPDPDLVSTLSEDERIVMDAFLNANWFRFRTQYFQYQEGFVTPESFRENTLPALSVYHPWFDMFENVGAQNAGNILTEFGYELAPLSC